jgi:hypothetical protein
MKKKHILIGIICIITLMLIFFKFREKETPMEILKLVEESESSLEKRGITNIGIINFPKYKKIEMEFYYENIYCLDKLEEVMKIFRGYKKSQNSNNLVMLKVTKDVNKLNKKELNKLKSLVNNIEFPVILFNGSAEIYDADNNYIKTVDSFTTLISGIGACSEKSLIFNICRYLKKPAKFCNRYSFPIKSSNMTEIKIPNDKQCYDCCYIEYNDDNNRIINQYWCGPPCNRVGWYIEGESRIINKQCYSQDSCISDINDQACCNKNQCVDDGKCYPPLSTRDVDSNGQRELCISIDDYGRWVNPDISNFSCSYAGFNWFDCSPSSECKKGINNYDEESKGLCCGDDKNEYFTECKGDICDSKDNNSDSACCDENECVYKGECYQSGCTTIKLNSGKIKRAFCEGTTNKWIDLDKDYCEECLGKKAWSGLVCCGDDVDEGKYYSRFIFHNKEGTQIIGYDACTNKKSNCIHPNINKSFYVGCYYFAQEDKYLQGGYYCDNSEWYSLNNYVEYCKKCGFNWIENNVLNTDVCCGDDKNEYFIRGEDGTIACCNSDRDIVINGVCYKSNLCGNNKLDKEEECEIPDSINNIYCEQLTEKCFDKKLGTRDIYGNCNSNCKCVEDQFKYSCIKDRCDAECGKDSECEEGYVCELSSCECKKTTYCGDNIVQELNYYNQREKCELPNTSMNSYCNQTDICSEKKTRINDELGYCDKNCQCNYNASYSCIKGKCGAECNQDGSGCNKGEICDTTNCVCYTIDYTIDKCGNNICEAGEEYSCPKDCQQIKCPYRIDIKLNKKNYFINDTTIIFVKIYNKDMELIPNIKFNLEVLVNDVYIGTSTPSTSPKGLYIEKKRVTALTPAGIHKYIAKTNISGCSIIGDSVSANFNTEISGVKTTGINRSRFIATYFTDFYSPVSYTPAVCGDNVIGYGEVCEGNSVCRVSLGCDYINQRYDTVEYCSSCDCPPDLWSKPADNSYCSNCAHCGDNIVNCGEVCENTTINKGPICYSGDLYERVDICLDCRWYDNGIESDILIENCECDCPSNPERNCVEGDYINYPDDYDAGCSNNVCNECECEDTYSKDTNNDGVEDKCSPELCANKIDDNDNGLIDEEGCIWYYCSDCGYGIFNLCDRTECGNFTQGCFFNRYDLKLFSNYGNCLACSSINSCEDYGDDNTTCLNDPCSIKNCYWNNLGCCGDSDGDRICDNEDNCPNTFNFDQENSDNDSKGNACDLCPYESVLIEPTEINEKTCNDNIDNDCDGLKDCIDPDCAGINNCCQSVFDCLQSNCVVEDCVNNNCNYLDRELCDNSECPFGYYCDSNATCSAPENSQEICISCINKYYLIQEEYKQAACCNSPTACVDETGKCHDSNTPIYDAHSLHCFINKWYECSENNYVLCAEAGSTYRREDKKLDKAQKEYRINRETGWYCTYDGHSFGWRRNYPKEICDDSIDNDCDGFIDISDTDCPNIGETE